MSKMVKPRRNGGGGVAENMMMEFDRSFFDYDNDDQYQQQNYGDEGGDDDNDQENGDEGYNNDDGDDEDHQEMEIEVLIPNSRMGLKDYQSTNLDPEMLDYLHEDQARESDTSFEPSSSETESEDRDDGDDDMLGYAKMLGGRKKSRRGKYSFRSKGSKGKIQPKNEEVCHPSIVILHQIKFPNRVNIFKTVKLRQEPYCTFILDENAFLKKIKLSNEKNRLVCRRTTFKTPNQQEVEKPYHCTVCEYRSVKSYYLKRHMIVHTRERPYQCPHCKYAAADIFKLNRHLVVHTGEKPFACEICQARFTQSDSLKSHRLIHTGEKPVFKCELCPSTCGRKTDLRVHFQRFHTTFKSPLKCKSCKKSFHDRSSFKLHSKTHKGSGSNTPQKTKKMSSHNITK